MFVVEVIFIFLSIFGQIHPFFGQVQRLMFIVVKFWSSSYVKIRHCQFFRLNFNQFLVILIRLSKLASILGEINNLVKSIEPRALAGRGGIYGFWVVELKSQKGPESKGVAHEVSI